MKSSRNAFSVGRLRLHTVNYLRCYEQRWPHTSMPVVAGAVASWRETHRTLVRQRMVQRADTVGQGLRDLHAVLDTRSASDRHVVRLCQHLL